jgi:hypothetical protein
MANVMTLEGWNGQPIQYVCSKGKRQVKAVLDVGNNLIIPSIAAWPPCQLKKKLSASGSIRFFTDDDQSLLTKSTGHYCSLQSINSEDAMTWSVFGPLIDSISEVRDKYIADLLNFLNLPKIAVSRADIRLWERVKHPQTGIKSHGPEIDFLVEGKGFLVLGEAKWHSKIDTKQGKAKDQTQMGLRKKYLMDLAKKGESDSCYVLLGVSANGGIVKNETDNALQIYVRDSRWDQICGIESHPLYQVLQTYLKWKVAHSS